jgi:surface protein
MSSMFTAAINFNMPLEKWDVSSVTNMYGMFATVTTFKESHGATLDITLGQDTILARLGQHLCEYVV